ncbi:class I SAM-dependent methyltransferase [Candidatus Pacearchaeota archaeon]|nr:class I SAM-dependent methyltransferase [Candidatus Pacearchaeota archaeon]
MQLNLGAGSDIREGAVNYDVNKDCLRPTGEDVCGDCEEGLPFKDDTFSRIVASHILEHIHNLRSLKRELLRVMKKDGELIVTVPDYTSPDAWGDDTHCRAFSNQSFFLDFWPGFTVLTLKDQPMMKANKQKVTWLVAHIMKN